MKDLKAFLVREQEDGYSVRLDAALASLGYEAIYVSNKEDLLGYIHNRYPACAVLLRTREDETIDTLREMRRLGSVLPVFVVTAHVSPGVSNEAVKSGAIVITAEAEGELAHAIRSGLNTRRDAANREADVFLGSSREMHELQAIVARIGPSDFPVLIQGETGTGKEVLARQVHAYSPRAGKVFLKLNCAALPSELVESELFGYDRGAFTGAFQRKLGLFELGEGGTILLDEIGDMDYKLQAKLLHVLQDHEFWRIGGKDPIRVDVRVIATTHRPLETMIVEGGGFRQDLYYRLSVLNVRLPPLRERRDEVVPLAEYLLHKHATPANPAPPMTTELIFALQNYHWPGNIRELENIIRRFLVLRDPDMIVRELQARVGYAPPPPAAPALTLGLAVLDQVARAKEKAEADAILAALEAARWNRKRAAAALQVDYKALLYKMKKLAIQQTTQNLELARAAKNSGNE